MINRSRLGFKEVGSVFSRSRFSSLFFPLFLFTVFINYLGQDVNSILIKFVEAKWRGVFQSQLGHTIIWELPGGEPSGVPYLIKPTWQC